MQFTTLVLAAAALVSSVNAKPILTATEYATITVGKAFNISWADATAPVTITLKNGPQTALVDFDVIGSGLPFPSGSIQWTPDLNLPNQQYALEIKDGPSASDINYAGPFQVIGATASVSAESSASSTASSPSSVTSVTSPTVTSTDSSASSTPTSSGSSSTGSKTTVSNASKTTTTPAPTTSVPGSAAGLASPLAMVLLAFAAILAFN